MDNDNVPSFGDQIPHLVNICSKLVLKCISLMLIENTSIIKYLLTNTCRTDIFPMEFYLKFIVLWSGQFCDQSFHFQMGHDL